jgi:hypothetical protein
MLLVKADDQKISTVKLNLDDAVYEPYLIGSGIPLIFAMPNKWGGLLSAVLGEIRVSPEMYDGQDISDILGQTHDIEIGFTETNEAGAVWLTKAHGVVTSILDYEVIISLTAKDYAGATLRKTYYDAPLDEIAEQYFSQAGVDFEADSGTYDDILIYYEADAVRLIKVIGEFCSATCCQLYYDYVDQKYRLRKLDIDADLETTSLGVNYFSVDFYQDRYARASCPASGETYESRDSGQEISQPTYYEADYEQIGAGTEHFEAGAYGRFDAAAWTGYAEAPDYDNRYYATARGKPFVWRNPFNEDHDIFKLQIILDGDRLYERSKYTYYRIWSEGGKRDVFVDQNYGYDPNYSMVGGHEDERYVTLGYYDFSSQTGWSDGDPDQARSLMWVCKYGYDDTYYIEAGKAYLEYTRISASQTTNPARLQAILENAELLRADLRIPLNMDMINALSGKFSFNYRWGDDWTEYTIIPWEYDIDFENNELIIRGPVV